MCEVKYRQVRVLHLQHPPNDWSVAMSTKQKIYVFMPVEIELYDTNSSIVGTIHTPKESEVITALEMGLGMEPEMVPHVMEMLKRAG